MSRLYMMVTITDRNRKKKFEEFYKKNEHMEPQIVRCWTISDWKNQKRS